MCRSLWSVLVVVIVVWLFVQRSNSELRSENIKCGPILSLQIHLTLIDPDLQIWHRYENLLFCAACSKRQTTIIYCLKLTAKLHYDRHMHEPKV